MPSDECCILNSLFSSCGRETDRAGKHQGGTFVFPTTKTLFQTDALVLLPTKKRVKARILGEGPHSAVGSEGGE